MGNYLVALPKLKAKEDLWDDDPDDAGGQTVWGITRRDHPGDPVWAIVDRCRKKPGFPENMRGLPELDKAVEAHYKPHYWDLVRGDQLDQPVAEELFDTAVNCGPVYAIRLLERLLNVGNRNQADYKDVPPDGKLDDDDLRRLKLLQGIRGTAAVVKALNALQAARYLEICVENAKMEKYWWGWILART